jgi:hypothetical protein
VWQDSDVQRTWLQSRTVASGALITALLTACSATVVHVPAPGAVPIPTLQTLPTDLSRSPQLAALVPRDTAGLQLDRPSAAGGLLAAALVALEALPDSPTKLSRLTIYADSINFTYEQNGINGRSVSAVYFGPDDLSVSEPTYDDSATYPVVEVDPTVPVALISAIEQQVPNGKATSVDLNVSLSYGYGLVWRIDVEDARGSLGTVYADLDGAIVGVDLT